MSLPHLAGLQVMRADCLSGCKRAVLRGKKLYVSPAMWRLMEGADARFLAILCSSIKVVDLNALERKEGWQA